MKAGARSAEALLRLLGGEKLAAQVTTVQMEKTFVQVVLMLLMTEQSTVISIRVSTS